MEEVFNNWARVRITDSSVKRLVQMAMTPNKEVLQKIKGDRQDELSTAFNNIVSGVMEYSLTSPTQQEATTQGTLFGAYNAVTGTFAFTAKKEGNPANTIQVTDGRFDVTFL